MSEKYLGITQHCCEPDPPCPHHNNNTSGPCSERKRRLATMQIVPDWEILLSVFPPGRGVTNQQCPGISDWSKLRILASDWLTSVIVYTRLIPFQPRPPPSPSVMCHPRHSVISVILHLDMMTSSWYQLSHWGLLVNYSQLNPIFVQNDCFKF